MHDLLLKGGPWWIRPRGWTECANVAVRDGVIAPHRQGHSECGSGPDRGDGGKRSSPLG